MITTKVQVKRHLSEYASAKYGQFEDGKLNYVQFPHKLDIYHIIWDLLVKRPKNTCRDEGNLIIALPSRAEGKNPLYYNYLGERSVGIIEKRLENMFFAELRSTFEENKNLGINFLDTAYKFICKYEIESITPDALIKDYYRYRMNVMRRKRTVRNYRKRSDDFF